jgi:tetratricopeptide (TPR) repeat protein
VGEVTVAGEGQADKEKAFKEACLAVRTGMSASENGNFKVAEPLLLRALDDFELCEVTNSKEYFQCLLYLADAYFHMERFFEAKGYYEQLSVARLKHPESTDAQVVVALLKLAVTLEKLGQFDDAINTYDLTLELAETTIPKGHALYGVIFDSFEILVERYIDEPDVRESRLASLKHKREEFGFTETLSGHYNALPAESVAQVEASANESAAEVLGQSADELRSTLSPWTHPELKEYAAELRARRGTHETEHPETSEAHAVTSVHDSDSAAAAVGEGVGMVHAHLTPEMFRPKRGQTHEPLPDAVAEHGPPVEQVHLDEKARRHLKQVNTEKRFNPLPVLTVLAAIGIVGGAIYFAHEYAENMVAVSTPVKATTGLDLAGKVFASADGKKVLRFTTAAACEYSSGGTTAAGTYHLKKADSSPLAGFFAGNAKKVLLKETESGYEGPDGTMYYADTSKERQILTKVQAVANFANYYFASHEHVYPASTADNQFGGTTFLWENPLTAAVNPPLVDSQKSSANSFEESFTKAVRDFRDLKPHFAVDDAEHAPAGLIECFALVPADQAAQAGGEGISALVIRAYDSQGKLIRASNPAKAFVVALKNGVSVDPVKAGREQGDVDPPAEVCSFEIEPLAAGQASAQAVPDTAKP